MPASQEAQGKSGLAQKVNEKELLLYHLVINTGNSAEPVSKEGKLEGYSTMSFENHGGTLTELRVRKVTVRFRRQKTVRVYEDKKASSMRVPMKKGDKRSVYVSLYSDKGGPSLFGEEIHEMLLRAEEAEVTNENIVDTIMPVMPREYSKLVLHLELKNQFSKKYRQKVCSLVQPLDSGGGLCFYTSTPVRRKFIPKWHEVRSKIKDWAGQ